MTLPYIRYARVSRMGDADRNRISVPEQIRKMDALAVEHGVPVHPDVFEDVNRSGGNLDRPQFMRAIELVRSGQAGGIIVATFDRFSRDVEDMLAMLRVIEAAGGRLICGDGATSLADGDAEFITTVRAAVSAQERRRRGDYLSDAIRNAVERGVHLGVPFGYRRSDGKGSVLAIEPEEAALVRAVYEWRAQGWSWQRIADAANARGPMPRPRRWKHDGDPVQSPWNSKTARGLLYGEESKLRRVYLGVAFNGEHETPNAHPAIVDAELFERATRAKGIKFSGPKGANPDGYLLSGFVRCAGCGYVMTYQGRDHLRCRTAQQASADCPAPASCPALALEQFVTDEYASWLSYALARVESSDTAHDEARAKVRDVETRLDSLMSQAERMSNPTPAIQARFDAQMDSLSHELADAQAAEARTRSISARPNPPAEEFADLSLDEQRRELSAVFDFVIVRRSVKWREPVESRSRVVWADESPKDNAGRIAFARTVPW